MYILRLLQSPDIALIAEELPGGDVASSERLAEALEVEARRIRQQIVGDQTPTTPDPALEG